MERHELADRILGVLLTSERTTQRASIPAVELCKRIDAVPEEVRAELFALDDLGYVRYLRGFRTGDVVVLRPAGRDRLKESAPRSQRRSA